MTRLEDLASRWTKDAMTREEVVDLLVREQFLSVLPHDVRVAVMERQPKDCSEASQVAENYLQARASSIVTGSPKTPSTKCPKCGRHGHWARDCPRPRNSEGGDAGSWTDCSGPKQGQLSQGPRDARSPNTDIQRVKCYNCNERGHYASSCPRRALYCGQPDATEANLDTRARRGGTVNGVYCTDILVDTGATHTLVHRRLVTNDDILDGEMRIRCAHGDTVAYSLAVIKVTMDGRDVITTAAVSDILPVSVLLGWNVPELMSYFTGDEQKRDLSSRQAFVVTRQQAHGQQPHQSAKAQEKEPHSRQHSV